MNILRARMFLRSLLLQAGFGDERRQALGFAWALDPALSEAYRRDPRALCAARMRHLAPFNTNPYAVGIILGTTAALEARAAVGDPALSARAAVLKSAAGASLAGAADAFFWGSLRPLAAALAVFVSTAFWRLRLPHPLAWGTAAGLISFNAAALASRWTGLARGLAQGEAALVVAAGLPVREWTRLARLATVGLLTAAAALAVSTGAASPPVFAACAFAAGAGLSRHAGGVLRLLVGVGILGAVAAAAGWTLL